MAMLGITVKEEVAAMVRGGVPVIETRLVPGSETYDNGRPIRFIDPRGVYLGAGIADPENEVLRVLSLDPVRAFDATFFRGRVRDALAFRRSIGLVQPDSSWRLVNGEGDGLSGFAVDIYGEYAVVYVYSRGMIELGRLLGQVVIDEAGVKGAVVKQRVKGEAKPGKVKQDIVGAEPPESYVVKELGVPFEVHLLSGLNVGLFNDMREHRRNLHRFVAGKRVLNTFCYTGAISVAAIRAGAAAVTSVDLSSGVLKWAAENFRLSGIDPVDPRWKFETADVLRFMEKQHQAGVQYDFIVMDPPTVSTARARQWSMRNDYPELIALAAGMLPDEGGVLWISANAHGSRGLMRHVEAGLKEASRRGSVVELGGLPPDFPTPATWPEGRYLEVCFLRVHPR